MSIIKLLVKLINKLQCHNLKNSIYENVIYHEFEITFSLQHEIRKIEQFKKIDTYNAAKCVMNLASKFNIEIRPKSDADFVDLIEIYDKSTIRIIKLNTNSDEIDEIIINAQ